MYGKRGQAQKGIDLYARLSNGRYATYQCKRYEEVLDSDIRNAVAKFREGDWLTKSERFVFCTSHPTVRTDHNEEIELQAGTLQADGVAFEIWDAEELSRLLKTRPRVVLDFFDRPWVEAFCTESLVDRDRLDAAEIARLRARLREFYDGLFARHDRLVTDETPISDRFVAPDVLRIRHMPQAVNTASPTDPSGTGDRDSRPPRTLTGKTDALLSERIPSKDWLQTHRRTLLLGGAGTGKSTLLRWLCLDLLSDEPRFGGPAADDGAFLAIWLPFGRWVAAIADGDRDISLPGMLERFFAAYAADELWRLVDRGLRDDRVVLLVDGLDEWSDESSANIAAERLQQYLFQRSLPALAASRPEGLQILRAIDPEWSTAELAPLSGEQQNRLLERLGAPEPAANALLRQTGGEARLHQLATNPLLLGLMWRLQNAGEGLPSNAQAVLSQFIRWMIRTQAAERRRIAEVGNPLDLEDDEVESALAALALATQGWPSPAVPAPDARRILRKFLNDGDALGLAPDQARAQARLLIEQARGPIGLLSQVDDDHLIFSHRALQEHLAGRALSALPLDRQVDAANSHAARPSWRNTLDALVWMAPSETDADAVVAAISDAAETPQASWVIMPLLAQLALSANRASPDVRKKLLEISACFVESDDRPGPRGDALDLLLTGAGRDATERFARWWPCRAEDRSGVLDAMHGWPEEPETQELWWRALGDENTATARKAGALLVDRLAGDANAEERLCDRLRGPLPVHSRAVALEALAHGWGECDELDVWIQRAMESADPNLRLVALDHLVRCGGRDESLLDQALELADGWIGLDFDRREQVGEVLAAGWSDHKRVRDAVLQTVDDQRRGRPIDIQLAIWLIVYSFSQDAEIRAWAERSLQSDRPFLLLSSGGWRLLGERYRDDTEMLPLLEALFAAPDAARDVELCELAVGLRTPVAHSYLRRLLYDQDRFLSASWPFRSLVEGWVDDSEVLDELRTFARSRDPRVAQVARMLDKVLPESEATTLLLELSRDEANERHAIALDALSGNNDPAVRAEAFEIGWSRRQEDRPFGERVAAVLLSGFGEQPRIRDFALEYLNSPDGKLELRAIALAGRHHADVREAVRRASSPLPVELRRRFTQRVFEERPRDGNIAAAWRLECDGMAAAAAASAVAATVSASGRAELIHEAVDALRARKFDHDVEGQAGLCALLELGEVRRFAEQNFAHDPHKPLWIEFGTLHRNWWMAARVAAHFETVRDALGDTMAERFNSRDDSHALWATIAPFAVQSPMLREAILDFIREHGTSGRPGLLRFLAAVRPRTQELADALVPVARGSVVDRSDSRTALLLAAELLAEHFPGDAGVLAALVGDGHPTEGELLALAMGWRRDPVARSRFDMAHQKRLPLSSDVGVRVRLLIGQSNEALGALFDWLPRGEREGWLVAPPTSAAVRRTAGDAAFAEALRLHLKGGGTPSETGSGARLLAAAGCLDQETRGVLEAQCDSALTGPDTDLVGLDMIAEELRPLGWILWDALHGAATTDLG
jgi:hypothetical protein